MTTQATTSAAVMVYDQNWSPIGVLSKNSNVQLLGQVSNGGGGGANPGTRYELANVVDAVTHIMTPTVWLPQGAIRRAAAPAAPPRPPAASGKTVVRRQNFADGSYRLTYSDGTSQNFQGSAPNQQAGAAPPPPPTATQQSWYVSNGHAYNSKGVDLGLFVAPSQAVQPTNSGRLWALYNINPNGSVSFVNSYGSVPGAPPPPNANQPQQFVPQPAPVYAPPPPAPYGYPSPYAASPYAAYPYPVAPPTLPAYAVPPPPPYPAAVPYAVDPTTGLPVGAVPPSVPMISGVPGYDPTTAALYTGAAFGAQAAAQQAAAQQPPPGYAVDPTTGQLVPIDPTTGLPVGAAGGMDPLTMSIMMGGGVPDMTGDFSGMAGGFDPTTLAALAGGDPNAAMMMAMQNGGYDPTGGMLGM